MDLSGISIIDIVSNLDVDLEIFEFKDTCNAFSFISFTGNRDGVYSFVGKSHTEIYKFLDRCGLNDVFSRIYESFESAFYPSQVLYNSDLVNGSDYYILNDEDKLAGDYRDITHQKRLESELKRGEEKYRLLVEAIPDLIVVHDLKGNIIFNNQAAARFLGYPDEDVKINIREITPESELEKIKARRAQRTSGVYDVFTYETSIWNYRGELVDVGIRSTPIVLDGELEGMLLCIRDISEQKEIREELSRSNERLVGFMESSTEGFILFDSEMNLVEINKVALDIFNACRDEITFGNIIELLPSISDSGLLGRYNKVLETGEPYFSDLSIETSTGLLYLNLKAFKVGNGLGIITSDVTDQVVYDKKLEELHELSNNLTLAENMMDIAEMVVSSAHIILECKQVSFSMVKGDKISLLSAIPESNIDEPSLGGPSVFARAVNTGEPQLVQDTSIDPDYLDATSSGKEQPLATYTVPVELNGNIVALLSLEEEKRNSFTDEKVKLTTIMIDHITATINAQDYRDKLEALHQYSNRISGADSIEEVADSTLKAINDIIDVFETEFVEFRGDKVRVVARTGRCPGPYDEIPTSFTDIPRPSILARTFDSCVSQIVPDVRIDSDYRDDRNGILSELAVPVIVNGSTIAGVHLESRSLNRFSEKDQRLVEVLAGYIGVAVSRIENRNHLRVLHEFALNINMYNRFDVIAELALEIIENVFGYSFSRIGVVEDNSLVFYYTCGLEVEPGYRLPLNSKGVSVRAVKMCETQVVTCVEMDPDYVSPVTEQGFRGHSMVAVPIFINGDVAAVIVIETMEFDDFSSGVVESLELLAAHISGRLTDFRLEAERLRADCAERMDAVKSRFMRTATHELRTPLTSMKGYLELARVENDPVKAGEFLEIAARNTERLEALTNDLLDQQRLEDGRLVINWERLDLLEVLDKSLEEVHNKVENRGQEVTVSSVVEDVLVVGDFMRLVQVFVNILDNASKYSPQDSVIRIRIEKKNAVVIISVIDEGIGLSDEDIDELFKPFPEIERPTVTEQSVGLGLSICKGIIDMHGGEIWAESPGPGEGSTFIFTIPRNQEKVNS